MSWRDDDDDGFMLFMFAVLLFVTSWIFWARYTEAFDKCEKAGKSPAFCHEYLK